VSALGQKQTFAVRYAMSALPPKADMRPIPNPSDPFATANYDLACASALANKNTARIIASFIEESFLRIAAHVSPPATLLPSRR
jgi:hypothetical protein